MLGQLQLFFLLLAARTIRGSVKLNIINDIIDKLKPSQGASGGSSYAKGGCGTGLHIYIDPADNNGGVESSDNSVSTKVSIHEYIHLLQQSYLNGEQTATSGPVSLRSEATSSTRFHVIYACSFTNQDTYGNVHLAALNAMPDDYKLLDVPTYVILYPNDDAGGNLGCYSLSDTEAETRANEIYDEIYGSTCSMTDAFMGNENTAFAEGAAEYYAMNMAGVWSTFDGATAWTNKLTDDKTACDIPSGANAGLLDINSGSAADMEAVADAYKDAGEPECADNPMSEIVYAAFLDYCSSEGFSCTHKNLFEVWIDAGTTGKMGWCNAFEAKYGKSWGEFVCFMEAQHGISSSCVAADVPCMAYAVESTDNDEEDDITPFVFAMLLFLFIAVLCLVFGMWGYFHYHARKKTDVDSERRSTQIHRTSKIQDETAFLAGTEARVVEEGVKASPGGGYAKVVPDPAGIEGCGD